MDSLPRKAPTPRPPGFAPAQYVRTPQPPVDAVQWLGDNREQVTGLMVGVSPRVAYVYKGQGDSLVLSTGDGTARVDIGDWIVKRSDRDIYLVQQDAFATLYEPASAAKPAQVAALSDPIIDRHVDFTDLTGDKLTIHAGVLRTNIFLRASEYGDERQTVSLLFSPADARGIADKLYQFANEIEGITDGR